MVFELANMKALFAVRTLERTRLLILFVVHLIAPNLLNPFERDCARAFAVYYWLVEQVAAILDAAEIRYALVPHTFFFARLCIAFMRYLLCPAFLHVIPSWLFIGLDREKR